PGAPAPPTATTQEPTAVTPTTATLDATVNPNGSTTDTFFQYSTDPNLKYNVTTLAGSGNPGYADGIGAAASFFDPQGVAVDGSGNIYVADSGNEVIRKITPAGVVS